MVGGLVLVTVDHSKGIEAAVSEYEEEKKHDECGQNNRFLELSASSAPSAEKLSHINQQI